MVTTMLLPTPLLASPAALPSSPLLLLSTPEVDQAAPFSIASQLLQPTFSFFLNPVPHQPPPGLLYLPANVALIAFFNYFYTFLQLDPADVSDQLKRQGASVPNTRPGKATAALITKVLTRISVLGSAFLGTMAAAPALVEGITHLTAFRGFAGTSILILVGCATDTARKVQAELVSQKYRTIELDDISAGGGGIPPPRTIELDDISVGGGGNPPPRMILSNCVVENAESFAPGLGSSLQIEAIASHEIRISYRWCLYRLPSENDTRFVILTRPHPSTHPCSPTDKGNDLEWTKPEYALATFFSNSGYLALLRNEPRQIPCVGNRMLGAVMRTNVSPFTNVVRRRNFGVRTASREWRVDKIFSSMSDDDWPSAVFEEHGLICFVGLPTSACFSASSSLIVDVVFHHLAACKSQVWLGAYFSSLDFSLCAISNHKTPSGTLRDPSGLPPSYGSCFRGDMLIECSALRLVQKLGFVICNPTHINDIISSFLDMVSPSLAPARSNRVRSLPPVPPIHYSRSVGTFSNPPLPCTAGRVPPPCCPSSRVFPPAARRVAFLPPAARRIAPSPAPVALRSPRPSSRRALPRCSSRRALPRCPKRPSRRACPPSRPYPRPTRPPRRPYARAPAPPRVRILGKKWCRLSREFWYKGET
ncbi:unnamed protein product [Closterium sp. NIES-53]